MIRGKRDKGFTLIEIIIVIGIIALAYTVAIPNFKIRIDGDVADHIARLRSDIRSAWDLSVLTGKPYRMVFELETGKYWLEGTDSTKFRIDAEPTQADKPLAIEKEEAAQIDDDFAKYEDLAGDEFPDPESGEKTKPTSPVINAKEDLKKPTWYQVSNPEWQGRDLGDYLIIGDMQTEHHERKISIEEHGKEAIVKLYFFPEGYCEKAVMHIYYRGGGELGIDTNQTPYTLLTHPRGVAKVVSENMEVDMTGAWDEAEDA